MNKSMNDSLIAVNHLTTEFGSGSDAVKVLNDVSFQINKSETFVSSAS